MVENKNSEASMASEQESSCCSTSSCCASPATVKYNTPKVGRNDPCPCGNGRKFKKCCGKNN